MIIIKRKTYHQIFHVWRQMWSSVFQLFLPADDQNPVCSVGQMRPPFPGCSMCSPEDTHADEVLPNIKRTSHFSVLLNQLHLWTESKCVESRVNFSTRSQHILILLDYTLTGHFIRHTCPTAR